MELMVINNMLKRDRILGASILVLSLFALIGCDEELVVKTTEVNGIIVEKEYEEATTEKVKKKKKNSSGKYVYETKKIPESYEVDIVYDGLEVEVDSKGLYNEVEVGYEITVMLNEYYNKKGKLVNRDIRYQK